MILALLTFFATCASVFYSGFLMTDNVFRAFEFTFALMTILGIHELAHLLFIKGKGPYFIPAPFTPLGTFGAIIITREREFPTIGALAGPVFSLFCSIVLFLYGLPGSKIVDEIPKGAMILPSPLILQPILQAWIPPEKHLDLAPLAFAGLVGIIVTGLNLSPIGMLDGGHVASKVGLVYWVLSAIAFYLLIKHGYWLFAMVGLLTLLRKTELQIESLPLVFISLGLFYLCFPFP